MLYQPSNIMPDEVNGSGTVDITDGIAVSWQVTGDSAMLAYKVDIMQNNAASTMVYSTDKVSLDTPFWGTNYKGETVRFTATLAYEDIVAVGMSNGYEYKLMVTQWWSADDSVQQTTASIFITRDTPVVTLTALSDPLTEKAASFTAVYTQAQGDPMKWCRWQIAYADDKDNPFVDTGNIYGTGDLQVDYDGFLTGNTYSVRCLVETSHGVAGTTGWEDFDVSYSTAATSLTASACQVRGDCCVWVSWARNLSADGYSIMRQTVGENRLIKIADVDSDAGQLRDYSARSGNTYIYYVFPVSLISYLTDPMVTAPVSVKYWFWSIIEARETAEKNNFSVMASHIFRMGAGGVSEGSFSNNNNPTISQNFTRYPTRQGVTANYLTGSVTGYIGTISQDKMEYTDSISQSEAIFELSNSENALFLVDPKGHFLRIHTSSATALSIDHKKLPMPQTMTVNWVEVGSTDNVHTIMYSGGDFYPVDRVILTSLHIDTNTGALLWDVPDDYTGTGSVLSLAASGALMQNPDGPFTAATMELDQSTGIVTAEL